MSSFTMPLWFYGPMKSLGCIIMPIWLYYVIITFICIVLGLTIIYLIASIICWGNQGGELNGDTDEITYYDKDPYKWK
jgi:hypothetical protein